MEDKEPGKEEGVRAAGRKIGERVSQKVVEGGEGLGNADGFIHLELSHRQRMPQTDIRLDRRASISVDLRAVEVEARPLAAC